MAERDIPDEVKIDLTRAATADIVDRIGRLFDEVAEGGGISRRVAKFDQIEDDVQRKIIAALRPPMLAIGQVLLAAGDELRHG